MLKYSRAIIFLTVLIFIFSTLEIFAEDIFLLDSSYTGGYIQFVSDDINNFFKVDSEKEYPSVNIFDGNVKTCWVCGSFKKNNNASLYIFLPSNYFHGNSLLNICTGCGYNKAFYLKNARPLKFKMSLYVAFSRAGAVTETGREYEIFPYSENRFLVLKDSFAIQTFYLDFDAKKTDEFLKKCKTKIDFKPEVEGYILKLSVLKIAEGNYYDDVCISELFLNDRFLTTACGKREKPVKISISTNEKTLVVLYDSGMKRKLSAEKGKIFQILDIAPNKRYLLLSMLPEKSEGRCETKKLFVDLCEMKVLNNEFKRQTGILVNDIMGFEKKGKKVFAVCVNSEVELP